MKRKHFSLLFFLSFGLMVAQSTLLPGDIAITGYNGSDGFVDEFTFLLLKDVEANTEVFFTDIGWDTANNEFKTGAPVGPGRSAEGVLQWFAPTSLPCGTEVRIFADLPGTGVTLYSSSGGGTTTETDPGFGLHPIQDQIIVYQGSHISPSMIYALQYGPDNWDDLSRPATTTSNTPPGLGTNIAYMGDNQGANYNCTVVHNVPNILTTLRTVNATNWTLSGRPGHLTTIGGCTYNQKIWDGVSWNPTAPDICSNVVISADYDTSTGGVETSFSACTLVVDAGFTLTVANGNYVEIETDVTVNGSLQVESQGNFIQNNDTSLFIDNSSGGVQLTKTKNMLKQYTYTYWSSPVIGETVDDTFGAVIHSRRFRFEASNFIDLLTEINNTNTFNPGPDDIDDDGDDWQITSGIMQPGIGYATIAKNGGSFPRIDNFIFTGAFNNGEILVPLVNNSLGSIYNDWNFIGNPYPGAISIPQFLSTNIGLIGVVYFWDQGTIEDSNAPGNEGLNFSKDDYAMHNGTGPTAASAGAGNIPNGFIASGQGVFVEALSSGSITFNNAMRSLSFAPNNSQIFRNETQKKSTNIDNKLWLNLTSNNGVFNQILVGYIDGATSNNDGVYYDAERVLTSGNYALLYSIINGDQGKFAIQGKNYSNLNDNEVIKLGLKTTITSPTMYNLSIEQLQGEFLNNSTIYLKDKLLNSIHNLSNLDYSFTSEIGEFNERFEIVFNTNTLSTENIATENNTLKIIELENDNVQFTTSNSLNIKSVKIFDLLGRKLYDLKGRSSSETYNLSILSNTVYIARVTLSNGVIITKKTVKNND